MEEGVADSRAPTSAASFLRGGYVVRVLAIALAYFVAAWLSLALAVPPGYATAVWPPSGIALAAALLLGRSAWPGIWMGAALANVGVEASFASAVIIASGNTLEALFGSWLIRRYVVDAARFERGEDVFKFLCCCAVAANIAPTVALLPLSLGHSLSWGEGLGNWWTWWQGDLSGMIVVTPLILSWSIRGGATWAAQRKLEVACFALALVATAALIIRGHAADFSSLSLTFLTLPFIVWGAFRFGQREVTTATGVICATAIWYLLAHSDADVAMSLNARLLMLLTFNTLVVATGLALVAVVGERDKVVEELRRRNRLLRSQVQKHAHYDPLTGLANAALFRQQLAGLLSVAVESGRKVAVALLDIERFKSINDTFGREAGDELLKEIAVRLGADRSASNIVARPGGDRFAFAVHGFESEDGIATTLDKGLALWFGVPYRLRNNELRLSARIGVALFPDDGEHPDLLYTHAESALKKAKSIRERRVFYTHGTSERVAEKLALENKLRRAIEHNEFVLHYQPKVSVDLRRLTGLEALIRWKSPELGLVPPMRFVPLLEETGMIIEAGSWALRRAVLDQQLWAAQGVPVPRIAVNVSPLQMRLRDFVERLQDAIAPAGTAPLIDLEITESHIMEDVDANIDKLRKLREFGIHIAIDDFGTGYSSLAYLTKLPVHVLKIDRSFVSRMLDDDHAMTLVQTILSLANTLKLTTVAEGVESEQQADVLYLLRCNEMQGYLVSRPIPFDQTTAFLAQAEHGTPGTSAQA